MASTWSLSSLDITSALQSGPIRDLDHPRHLACRSAPFKDLQVNFRTKPYRAYKYLLVLFFTTLTGQNRFPSTQKKLLKSEKFSYYR